MDADRNGIEKCLREAGLSDPLIDAAWPTWWSDEASYSPSAKAELRFSIARKLGLSPKSLFHDEVEFIWKDDARFKHLLNETDEQKSALTSFGVSVSRLLLQLTNVAAKRGNVGALDLRATILQNRQFVNLQTLLAMCWVIGIPVIHLRVFPLKAKRMHAMAVKVAGRHSILLGRDAKYPAPLAFTLAHEIGHIMLGHVDAYSAIVDLDDPTESRIGDTEEDEADRFALELLLGTPNPEFKLNVSRFNAAQLAQVVLEHGPKLRIEPGSLALCLAFATEKWPIANAALQYIYAEPKPVWREVNLIAERELNLSAVNDDSTDYLRKIMGIGDA